MLTFPAKSRASRFLPLCFLLSPISSRPLASFTSSTSSYHVSLVLGQLKNHKLDQAREIYNKMEIPDVNISTMLISRYARDLRLGEALELFEGMPIRDTVCWNSMIKGCIDCGNLDMGFKLFDQMPERNVISWTTVLNGVLGLGQVEMAERLFSRMPFKDVAAWNSMINGYFVNGRVEDGIRLFKSMSCRNVISWTTVISGLERYGKNEEALDYFKRMMDFGVDPSSTTFCCALTACANVSALCQGVQLHGYIVKSGCISHSYVLASLISFYSNCKQIQNSCKVFEDKMLANVVIWTALLTGYGVNDEHENALKVLRQMIQRGVHPNQSSFTSSLNSCCELESNDWGKIVHATTVKEGLETDAFVGNSLVVMYAKCGNLCDAVIAFKGIGEKNLVSWNSILVGCAQHGFGKLSLMFFSQMIRACVAPDEITLTGLLSSCSHSGMLQKGKSIFKYFSGLKTVSVNLEHYSSMVDIFGRCGNLKDAEEFITSMPVKANSMVWLALLSASKMHSNFELAERAASCILDLEPHCSAAYTLLSNLYASTNRWNDVSRVRGLMKQRGIVKQPGCSWVILKGSRQEFLSGDRSHPLSKRIYEKLDSLKPKMKELGYVVDKSLALHDVEDEQKEVILSHHSERLAVGFALISTVEGSTITVMKNLRICGDCHSAIKLIAKIVGREIVIRDSSRFHHFRGGICSCGDYW